MAEVATPKAVLFDFGGVIVSSPFESFARFERERGLPEGFIRKVNATNPHENSWARLERSELSLAEFDEAFAEESELMGQRVAGGEVLALLAGDLRPSMVEAVRRCKEHFRTGLLTNNVLAMSSGSHVVDPFSEVLAHFDAIVESSRIGVRKPEIRFYEIALREIGVTADEAVFLDDLGVNLKPAREMGMRTIKVGDPEEALRELEAILGIDLTR